MWNSMSHGDKGRPRLRPGRRLMMCTAIAVAGAACAGLLNPGSDGAMKVRGEIVADGGEPCLMELRRPGSETVVERFTAKGIFERTITLEPGTRSYYFVVTCSGAAPYTSRTYQIGGTTYFDRPLDLGRLYFPRPK